MADLEKILRWAERDDKDADPWEFCRTHYPGLTRGQLVKRDSGLYQRLRKDSLLDKVPSADMSEVRKHSSKYGPDPVAYYHQHHAGLTQAQLRKHNYGLYLRLKRDELLDTIPVFDIAQIQKIFYQRWEEGKPVTLSYFTRTLGFSELLMSRIAEESIELEGERIQLKELLYDDVVIAGKTLQEIAVNIGSTHRQRADQYLRRTGQYEKWEAMKELRKEREAEEQKHEAEERMKLTGPRKQLLDMLVAKMVNDTKDDWPLQTALRICRGRSHEKPNSHSMEKLTELFQWYEYAVEQDDPKSLNEFSSETRISNIYIGKLFRQAGVQPLRRQGLEKGYIKPPRHLSSPEKQRIRKGLARTRFSIADLGYFLRLPFWNVSQNLPPGAEHSKPRPNYGISHFSYRIASEIYEASSTMSDEEIQYVLGLQDNSYLKYLQSQPKISRDIMQGLRAIYPEKARYVQKPFVPPEIRRLQQQETFEQVVVNKVRTAIRQGAKGVVELEEMTGHSMETIQKYASTAGIELPGQNRKIGDPLQYCNEHYPDITRKELMEKDSSLYQKLSKKRLLGAIPVK